MAELAHIAQYEELYFTSLCRKLTRQSLIRLRTSVRMSEAQRLLKYTPLPIGEITKYRRCAQTPLGPGQGAPDKYESSP